MNGSISMMVSLLPRDPFIPHSKVLFDFLSRSLSGSFEKAIEIGCGKASPFPTWLESLGCTSLLQIDARADVIDDARAHCSWAKVEHMVASELTGIGDASQDLIVAMSVFDQNERSLLNSIGRELFRVLRTGGQFLYIHNEELNLPSAAASLLEAKVPQLLLPSDSWEPTNELDYCSVARAPVEQIALQNRTECAALIQYLRGIYAPILDRASPTRSASNVSTAPFIKQCSPSFFSEVRKCVAWLRNHVDVELHDHRTSALLSDHVENGLLGGLPVHIVESGQYEIVVSSPWRKYLAERPNEKYFVRGMGRFGFSSSAEPPSLTGAKRLGSIQADSIEDELVFIAHQYGIVARKCG